MRTTLSLLAVLTLLASGCSTAEQFMNDAMAGVPGASAPPPPATVTEANWRSKIPHAAHEDYGSRHTFDCPPNPNRTGMGALRGSGPYRVDSSVCMAGVHAGVIALEEGGRVVVEVVRGQNRYPGSTRNGVTSQDWGAARPSSMAVVNR